jgi:hypothetical protein
MVCCLIIGHFSKKLSESNDDSHLQRHRLDHIGYQLSLFDKKGLTKV